jgi:hypothetical protein
MSRAACSLPIGMQVESLLERSSAAAAGEEPGPDTELEHWRQQMSRFNSLTEQLKTHECRLVLGVTSMTHSPVRIHAGLCQVPMVKLGTLGWCTHPRCHVDRCHVGSCNAMAVCLWLGRQHPATGNELLYPVLCMPCRPTSAGRGWRCALQTQPTRPRTTCATWQPWTSRSR